MDKKLLAKKLRGLSEPKQDGIHIHIHMDNAPKKEEPERKEKPEWVDEDGYVKVNGMSPSVS